MLYLIFNNTIRSIAIRIGAGIERIQTIHMTLIFINSWFPRDTK